MVSDENIAFDAEREMGPEAYADWLEAYNNEDHPYHFMAVDALPAIDPTSKDFMYPAKEEKLDRDLQQRIMSGEPVVVEKQHNLQKVINEVLQEQPDWRKRLKGAQEDVKGMLRKRYGTGRGRADIEPPGRQIATERDLNPGGYPVKFVYDSKGNQWEIPFGSSLHKYLHKIYPESFPPPTHLAYYELHGRWDTDPPGRSIFPLGQEGRGGSDPVYMPSELELDEPPIDPSTGEPETYSDILDTPENRERLVKVLRHGTGFTEPAIHKAAAQWDPKKNIRSFDEYMRDISTAAAMPVRPDPADPSSLRDPSGLRRHAKTVETEAGRF